MKANRPYKTVNGKRITLTDKEVKAYIMRVNNWTNEEYNRQRYIMKNKLRTYEAFTGVDTAHAQSPTNVLYFEAKSKAELTARGKPYKPSQEMQRLRSFTGLGSAKQIQKAMQNAKARERLGKQYEKATFDKFSGLIAKNDKAREISIMVTDPVKREQALAEYARYIKWNIQQQDAYYRKIAEEGGVPIGYGETIGSDTGFDDFDYSYYLD